MNNHCAKKNEINCKIIFGFFYLRVRNGLPKGVMKCIWFLVPCFVYSLYKDSTVVWLLEDFLWYKELEK